MNRAVTIIGCGVSGLTTALVLQQEGWKVTIFTDQLSENTTSAIAAAIWFPTKFGPRKRPINGVRVLPPL
ncbi:MAG: FAD-binding oxidoreductase [Saprospirales bacterium]|nr:FAD-binding oxidoreductase [Saprospirales bacterium]